MDNSEQSGDSVGPKDAQVEPSNKHGPISQSTQITKNTDKDNFATQSSSKDVAPSEQPIVEPKTPVEEVDRSSPNSHVFVDPTPKTPRASSPSKGSPTRLENHEEDGAPDSEIQSIMEQFDSPSQEEKGNVKPCASLGEPVIFPPRRSSLDPSLEDLQSPLKPDAVAHTGSDGLVDSDTRSTITGALPPRISSLPQHESEKPGLMSPQSSTSNLPKELPPTPDPEPDLPFDFHRFLEQLRHRTADPVAKYLKSFLTEFGKKQWTAVEQVKFIHDFLTFIAKKMALCDIWRGTSDAEFDNAREGMEKLVMNRLYTQTFSPAVPPPAPSLRMKGKKKNIENLLGAGRRGQHQEDVERDEILSQKVRIYGWIQEEHLDIKPVGSSSQRLLNLAQQELLKITTYRAPRDKVICILNSCKVIFGLLRNSKASDTSADAFVPLLILVVLRANPAHLVSNVQYILRFRNPDKLNGEAGYYLSSLMGAIQFIENLDRTALTISDEEFEKKVEKAVSSIAERNEQHIHPPSESSHVVGNMQISEKSTLSQPQVTSQNTVAVEPQKFPYREKPYISQNLNNPEDGTAVDGLLRTMKRPLSSLGKIFSDDDDHNRPPPQNLVPPPQPPRRLSPNMFQPPRHSDELESPERASQNSALPNQRPPINMKAEDAAAAAARQASAEAAQAQRIQQAEHQNVVETLAGMFPNLDRDVIDDVVRQKQGRVGLAVDACLALNT